MSGKSQHYWFFILEGKQIDLHLRPLPAHAGQLLSPDAVITVGHQELWLLPQLELPSSEEDEPPEVSLGNHGPPCLLCHLLPWPVCWEWAFLHSGLQSTALPFLASPLGASSSMLCIHSLTSYAAVRVLITFIIPLVHPGPLALILISTTASAVAWWPSCTVFMVTSTWVALLAQLMGPVKLNPTSLSFPKGSPSLHDHHPKNRIASPWASTTASVICSLRPSWNISSINEPLHSWEGGGW